MTRSWERQFKPALVDGYSDFRGHWVDGDIAAYVFSYSVPREMTLEQAVAAITNRFNGYRLTNQGNGTVEFRSPMTKDAGGFFEWVFRTDPAAHRIFVLYAAVDSSERHLQNELMSKLATIAAVPSERAERGYPLKLK
jgi:hypothetical protein